jgi:hypothetical protein
MGNENAYMWHDHMCEKCTLVAKESLIGCYIYHNCNVVVTCYQSVTCQHNQTWLLATVFMVCTYYCIDMSILQLTIITIQFHDFLM